MVCVYGGWEVRVEDRNFSELILPWALVWALFLTYMQNQLHCMWSFEGVGGEYADLHDDVTWGVVGHQQVNTTIRSCNLFSLLLVRSTLVLRCTWKESR